MKAPNRMSVMSRWGSYDNSSARARSKLPVSTTAYPAWRDQFLAAGQAGLKRRATEARDEDYRQLQAKIGERLMETDLLYAKVDRLEASGPLARRRSTR